MADETPYRVETHDGVHRVMNPSDMTVVECRDRPTAEHHADLLNRAFRAGYKVGYRDGKRAR